MNDTLVIASRELKERSRIFIIAAAFAVLPFLVALLPTVRNDRATTIAAFGFFASIVVAAGTALTLGLSSVGAELSARRLSFYFSKPVSPAAIWFGKAIASLLVSFACLAIIGLPAYLAARDGWTLMTTLTGERTLLFVAIALVVLFLLGHTVGTMVRSRSALMAIDFVAAVVAIGALFPLLRPVLLGSGLQISIRIVIAIGVAVLAILAIAPVWQLANGRTDVRRSHTALSRFLWPCVAAVLLIAAAYATWLVKPDLDDVTRVVDLQQAPSSNWMLVSGGSKGRGDYIATFAIDASTGKAYRVESPRWWGEQFSRDGRVVAWFRPAEGVRFDRQLEHFMDFELCTRKLDDPRESTISTGITAPVGSEVALSDDGARAAIATPKLISVYDLGTRKLIVSAGGFATFQKATFFVGPDVVRIVEYGNGSKVRIFELDIAHRRLTKTGELEVPNGVRMVSASADGSRLLLRRSSLVVDGRTGAVLATLPPTLQPLSSAMLRDGRVVIIDDDRKHARVRVFGLHGEQLSDVALTTPSAWVSGEMSDGKIMVAGFAGRTMFVIDPARNRIEHAIRNLKGPIPNWRDPRLAQFRAGQLLGGVDRSGKLVLWDPETGTVKPL